MIFIKKIVYLNMCVLKRERTILMNINIRRITVHIIQGFMHLANSQGNDEHVWAKCVTLDGAYIDLDG